MLANGQTTDVLIYQLEHPKVPATKVAVQVRPEKLCIFHHLLLLWEGSNLQLFNLKNNTVVWKKNHLIFDFVGDRFIKQVFPYVESLSLTVPNMKGTIGLVQYDALNTEPFSQVETKKFHVLEFAANKLGTFRSFSVMKTKEMVRLGDKIESL